MAGREGIALQAYLDRRRLQHQHQVAERYAEWAGFTLHFPKHCFSPINVCPVLAVQERNSCSSMRQRGAP
jgi:hypothetical protein